MRRSGANHDKNPDSGFFSGGQGHPRVKKYPQECVNKSFVLYHNNGTSLAKKY